MRKGLDIVLVNSFAPRQRIASDCALENSLPLIRTYLEEKGFSAYVVDEQRISSIDQGVPHWLLRLLRLFAKWQMQSGKYGFKIFTLFMILLAWPFQAVAIQYRTAHMNKLIANIVNLVKTDSIPIVGIKVWYGDAYRWSLQLAEAIKQANLETVVIAGGPHVKVYAERVLAETVFDLAIMGPGEKVLTKLLHLRYKTKDKQEFLSLVHKEIGSTRLIRTGQYADKDITPDISVTIPRYQFADLQDKILFHTIVDGIGCSWNKCNFCSHTRQCITYTPRPVEEIRDEISTMTRLGIGFFRFSSSETPLTHGRSIAQMLIDNKFSINYSLFARAGKVTQETYDAYKIMIQSGLRAVFMGGETGHDLVNAHIMNKGVTRQDLCDTIRCIKLAAADAGANCRIGLSLIYPCPVIPGVSLDDVFRENISLITDTVPDAVIINPPGLFPETPWFKNPGAYGFTISDNFVTDMMRYEYSIYKPAELWPKLDVSLNGQDFIALLRESGRLTRAVEDLGIPMGVSDELLMMLDAIGLQSKADRMQFRKHSLIDIMSGTSYYIGDITKRINEQSKRLAYTNHPYLTK